MAYTVTEFLQSLPEEALKGLLSLEVVPKDPNMKQTAELFTRLIHGQVQGELNMRELTRSHRPPRWIR